MDVGELLQFKPSLPQKRNLDKDGGSQKFTATLATSVAPAAKRRAPELSESATKVRNESRRDARGDQADRLSRNRTEKEEISKQDGEKERILKLVEEQGEGEAMDASAVRRMILSFEKKSLKNQEMRMKYPDNPERFMESELELHDEIQQLRAVATVPEHYSLLVDLGTVQSLLGLLSHENTDVSIGVVDLVQELTDVDTLNESEDGAEALIDALLEGQIVSLLIQNLERLNESVQEDANGVHNILGIVENLIEFRPEVAQLAAEQGLMPWLLKRLKTARGTFDANKLYASEILAILLQNHKGNRVTLGELNGVDTLLQCLSYYTRRNPQSSDEQEMLENLFDALCSALTCSPNRERFLKAEGLQLMILMLKEKMASRCGALKVLNYAMTNAEGASNCNVFVDVLGLRSLFPNFMKFPKKGRKGSTESEHEEHVCSIIASLFRNLSSANKTRLLRKFQEDNCAKVERLMELHRKYSDRVGNVDREIEQEKADMTDDELAGKQDDFYMRRLDGGLFCLQLVDYVIGEVYVHGGDESRHRILTVLAQHKDSIKSVKKVLREYADNVGDLDDKINRDLERQRLLSLLSEL
ncbi:beta-catenin-like protein 1 [Corticium candelabrum]|uniref:beta-catenin-like protein 1 n=1 Tax=Corticium candelabrum TaxID=121492 RepID=UPI002E267A4F|nr:beta-catenin-like protein 1 [Corticium candelabrum]